jgi:hypothetical protein
MKPTMEPTVVSPLIANLRFVIAGEVAPQARIGLQETDENVLELSPRQRVPFAVQPDVAVGEVSDQQRPLLEQVD